MLQEHAHVYLGINSAVGIAVSTSKVEGRT